MEKKLATFDFTNENMDQFSRDIIRPMDCVINALQLLKLLDNDTAQLLRLSCVGTQGLVINQIEKMTNYMSYRKDGTLMMFSEIDNWDVFVELISSTLNYNSACFCGYRNNQGFSHVFVIARDENGDLFLLDPQMDTELCILSEDACVNEIKNNINSWYVLEVTNIDLNDEIMDIIVTNEHDVEDLLPEIFENV